MSIYLILFLSGAIGIATMALLGMNRHSHDGHGGHHHHGHAHGHEGAHAGPHTGHHHGGQHHHGGHGHDHGHSEGPGPRQGNQGAGVVDSSAASWNLPKYLFLISPMDVFATAFAAGAAGLLLKNALGPVLLPWVAAAIGIAFAYGLVRPLFGLAQKFASKPSEGLEGTVTHTATAISRFDSQGRGLVRIIFDNEETQCLAVLDHDDLLAGTQVLKGDQVVILEVDPVKNSCRVSKI